MQISKTNVYTLVEVKISQETGTGNEIICTVSNLLQGEPAVNFPQILLLGCFLPQLLSVRAVSCDYRLATVHKGV